jgi:hypothetical protein
MWSQFVCQSKVISLFNVEVNEVCGDFGFTVAQGGFRQPAFGLFKGTPNCPPEGENSIVCGKKFGKSWAS